ncbi:MAG: glycosyltransferase family 4 protein [Elusimicrobia bacterium]|nr:glycosyltransferase family 4 protein [Elusimicrobiota bacterium]
MNILHVLDEPYDSGIADYALSAASGLSERGHLSCVAGLPGCAPLNRAADLGLKTYDFSNPWMGLPGFRLFLRRSKVQLIVAHTGSAHTAAVTATRGAQIKVVRVRGDARPMRSRPGMGLLWSRTAGFIAANRAILEAAAKLIGDVPSAAIYQGLKDPGPAAPLPQMPPCVGLVGRLDPVKGHGIFILAAARVLRRFPQARFLVAGREENVSIRELRRLALEHGLKDSLMLLSRVPDVCEVMRRCHVGVIASIGSEAVSRAAVEWLSQGRPLVATAVGCLPEYLQGGECGRIVAPNDPGALAEAVCAFLEAPEDISRASVAARRLFEERFPLERFLCETESFYRSVCPA